MILIVIFVTAVFFYCLVSARLDRTMVTPPIVFTLIGMLVLAVLPEYREREGDRKAFLHAAEAGLVLLLFADASRTNLSLLRSIQRLPARLLGIGMPLTLILGGLVAMVVFGQLSVWEAGIVSCILAPTDAGLGQVVVSSPRVPLPVRTSVNVEAGLNDGLSVPFLLFFIAMVAPDVNEREANLLEFVIEQLGYGMAVGIAIGLAGGLLLRAAHQKRWIDSSFNQIGVIALPVLCILASDSVGASMFIAAFVAGLAVQAPFKEAGGHCVEFTEKWGQIINFCIFFLFGMLVMRDWREFRPSHFIYAILSLTIIRMLPVAISLIGTGLSKPTVLFMGWFGPRGLASIVLGVVFLEHATDDLNDNTIRLAIMATVLLSIFAHGLTAMPGIEAYSRKIAQLEADAPEHKGAEVGSGQAAHP
jgi:NhaP-type Na+/H+ or K+/H+ antiporter